jgi:predicted amidohydrolase YtcJ
LRLAKLGWAVCLALLIESPALADTLIDNINGISLDSGGLVQRFNGLLITNDGKVGRTFTSKDKRPDRVDFRLDGKGRTVLPGFIDSHGHVIKLGLQALSLDLSDTRTLEEAKTKIAAYAAAHPDRKWIIGTGWNQEHWGLGSFPTSADLDAVVPDRPVWLMRVDGHAGWANSLAMKLAGIAQKPPRASGGVFVDRAMEPFGKVIPQPSAKDRDLALGKAQEILLRNGITSIADMGTTVDDWLSFRRAGDGGTLQIRIFAYAAGIEPMASIGGGAPTPWLYDDHLRMGGVKIYADGALGSRGAWLKTPYADRPGERGQPFLDTTKLSNLMSRAAMDGFQVAVHAIGDAANTQVLDAVEELSFTYKGDRRWRIEHAQIIDAIDLPRFGKNGIIASMQPVHQTSDRQMAEARLGASRLGGAYAWNSILKAGGHLAFGSDTPVESPNPFAGWSTAVTREDAKGEPFGGWQPQERISREAAFAGYTIGAAFASFAEDKVGRLAPGLRADLIFVDRDPLIATPTELRATQVLETWVSGRRVWVRGR